MRPRHCVNLRSRPREGGREGGRTKNQSGRVGTRRHWTSHCDDLFSISGAQHERARREGEGRRAVDRELINDIRRERERERETRSIELCAHLTSFYNCRRPSGAFAGGQKTSSPPFLPPAPPNVIHSMRDPSSASHLGQSVQFSAGVPSLPLLFSRAVTVFRGTHSLPLRNASPEDTVSRSALFISHYRVI